jgi:hypothetical protein
LPGNAGPVLAAAAKEPSLVLRGADIATDFVPYVSNVKDATIAITGVNPVTKERVGTVGRVTAGVFALPAVGNVLKYIGKGGKYVLKGGKAAYEGVVAARAASKAAKALEREVAEAAVERAEKEAAKRTEMAVAAAAEKEAAERAEKEAAERAAKEATRAETKGVEIVDSKGNPLGEFDGVTKDRFIEDKSAKGLETLNPKTGKPVQTADQWAQKQIYDKTKVRIDNLTNKATATRPTKGGSPTVPTLSELRGIRKLEFRIESSVPEVRAAVEKQLGTLRAEHPDWSFSVIYGP